MNYDSLKKFLFLFDPEFTHDAAVILLKYNLIPACGNKVIDSRLTQKIANIKFPNPVGLAAGFDKDAVLINNLAKFGFGFLEAGTVTLKAQKGNVKPRLYRLAEDESIINKMGFNNKGIDNFLNNLSKFNRDIILGINIGKNKDSVDPIDDYLQLLEKIYTKSDYITVNISSPNTPGLRDLQNKDYLDDFLNKLNLKRNELIKIHNKYIPIFLKICPDASDLQYENIVNATLANSIDALIISNTTTQRDSNLKAAYIPAEGGLSGRSLFKLSTQKIAQIYKLSQGKIPIIGVGGISSGKDAYEKILAGASLVQIYSGLIYQGMNLINNINKELLYYMERDNIKHISEAIGLNCNNYD